MTTEELRRLVISLFNTKMPFNQQLALGGTLDMRADYLRPSKGTKLIASAEVIRR